MYKTDHLPLLSYEAICADKPDKANAATVQLRYVGQSMLDYSRSHKKSLYATMQHFNSLNISTLLTSPP